MPPANAPGRTNEIPAGIAVSRGWQKTLCRAAIFPTAWLELDAATGNVLRTWDVGVAPFDVALGQNKIYVSNWGGRRPGRGQPDRSRRAGHAVRVDERCIASEGSVSVIDLDPKPDLRNPISEILTGLHACALALSPNGRYLVVANAGQRHIERD